MATKRTPATDSGRTLVPVSRSDLRIGLSGHLDRPAFVVDGSDDGGGADALISKISRRHGNCSTATQLFLALAGTAAGDVDPRCGDSLLRRAKGFGVCRDLDIDIDRYNPDLTAAAMLAVESALRGDGKLSLSTLIALLVRLSSTYFRDDMERQHLTAFLSMYGARELEAAVVDKDRHICYLDDMVDDKARLALQKGEAELRCVLLEQKLSRVEQEKADMQQRLTTVTEEKAVTVQQLQVSRAFLERAAPHLMSRSSNATIGAGDAAGEKCQDEENLQTEQWFGHALEHEHMSQQAVSR